MLGASAHIRDIKKELGLRGWRLLFDEEGKPYLSKFCDKNIDDNRNEYRVYFLLKKDKSFLITRRIFIPNYKYHKKETVPETHEYIKEAKLILKTYEKKMINEINTYFPYIEVAGVV